MSRENLSNKIAIILVNVLLKHKQSDFIFPSKSKPWLINLFKKHKNIPAQMLNILFERATDYHSKQSHLYRVNCFKWAKSLIDFIHTTLKLSITPELEHFIRNRRDFFESLANNPKLLFIASQQKLMLPTSTKDEIGMTLLQHLLKSYYSDRAQNKNFSLSLAIYLLYVTDTNSTHQTENKPSFSSLLL